MWKNTHLNVRGSCCEYLLVDGEGDGHGHKREPAKDKHHLWSLGREGQQTPTTLTAGGLVLPVDEVGGSIHGVDDPRRLVG